MTAVSEFADKLLDAVKERKGLAPLSDTMDLDEATALDVQEAVVQARVDAGFPIVGAKLGLTSKAKQQQMSVDRPLRLPAPGATASPEIEVDFGDEGAFANINSTSDLARLAAP